MIYKGVNDFGRTILRGIQKMLDRIFFAVPNSAISGQLGWRREARAETALRAQKTVSKSPNNISSKARRCVVCTAEPHLAYDCSALVLESLNPIHLYIRKNE